MMIALAAALLFWTVNIRAQNGTWTNLVNGNAGGSWSAAVNWNNGVIADGADSTADFSTLNITNLSTVTLDGARTIGNLVFGDATPDTNWVLNTGSGDPLTLSVSAGSPTITVNNQTATIGAVLAGAGGFTKAGAGTLMLNNTGNLGLVGTITVTGGVLGAAANNGTLGADSDGAGANLIIVTNGGTLYLRPNTQINNKQLRISGAGAGGRGALDADASGTSNGTRWGIGGSSSLVPFITLTADATLRVDGASAGNNNDIVLLHSLDIGTNTLTKTGGGRLNFDQQNRTSGDGLVHVAEGALGFRSGGFTGGRSLLVDAGAEARITGDNNAMNSTVNTVTINGQIDLDARGTGSVGSDTTTFSQRIGLLAGSGTITSGTFGNIGIQTLTVEHDATTNSTFNGTITQANGVLNLVKAGANTLTLTGNNNYAGATTINAGTLAIDGTYTGSGGYAVNSGAILAGSGAISAIITNNTGTIMAGDPVTGGTLTINSNILGNYSDTVVISNATLAANAYIGPNSQVVGTLYMTNGTLKIPLRTTGPSAFVSTLTVDGNATINFSMGTPLVGQFPIISYGSIGGLAGFSGLSLVAPAGVTATLSNNAANLTIDVVITAIPALTWNGTPGNTWSVGGGNWQGGGTYSDGLFVTFDDTLAGSSSVDLSGTLSPKGVTVNNSSANYTFSGSGKISGTGGIAKLGNKTLVVANSGGNDFTGGVNINGGTVQVGNGGTAGDLGSGPVANLGTLALNRSDSFTLSNTVSGNGAITKAGAGTATVPVSGDSSGAVTVNAGTLLLGPAGTSKFAGNVTGSGAFGVNGGGRLILSSSGNSYSGGTVISNGTLQFGDEFGSGALPAAGNLTDNGTLATTLSGTLANNISGSGGVSVISNANITLNGANTYAGPTKVFGGSVTGDAANYSPNSALILGDQSGNSGAIGSAYFNSGNPVMSGLKVGGNSFNPNTLGLYGSSQTLTINGDVSVGAVAPSAAAVLLRPTGSGVSVVINTNGGTFQIGLGATSSGVNPDNVFVDFSSIDNFIANLGTNGTINMGTLDGNPGPSSGATVVNQFYLAAVSNVITAGAFNIGAGGRQLVPDLQLGDGTNILNVAALTAGFGGRDGSYVHFHSGGGGLRLRGNDGVSPATFNIGVNPGTGTGASITNTVDFTGHPVDLLIGNLVIGDYNNAGVYQCALSFDTGVLNAQSTSLSVIRNNNGNAAASGSTLNIGGGTASLGTVSLTASAAYGALNINNASVTAVNITSPGSGQASLNITNSTLNLNLAGFGNPAAAPVAVDTFNADGTVNLTVNGTGLAVGQFPLISYAGSIGGTGFPALHLSGLPANVAGYLSNYTANASVDLVITSAPATINPNPTNIVVSVSGNQMTLQWDSDHLGWLLQSNSVSLSNTGAWVTVTGSGSTNKFTFPVDAAKTNVFFRMLKP